MPDVMTSLVASIPSLVKLAEKLATTTGASERNAQLIEFQKSIIDFQSKIASVQAENSTLLNAKQDLENEVARLKDWGAEQSRYQLHTAYGNPVYALKEAMAAGEPPHYLCANCFHKKEKAFLGTATDKDGYLSYACSRCKATLATRMRGIRAHYAGSEA